MKVYGMPRTRATRVTWTLEELGADYEYVKVDLGRGGGRAPAYRELNPAGKVPSLIDGDLVLTESAAICTYLAETFPEAGLIPAPGTPARARYFQWCTFVVSELEQPLWTIAKHTFVLPEPRRAAAVIDTARWEFERVAEILAQGLGDSPYIVGDEFTTADVLVAHTLRWARNAVEDLGHGNLDSYADRLLARPALARAWEREDLAS